MSPLLSTPVVSDLIGAIHECAIDPARWPDTLGRLREALNFRMANIAAYSWSLRDVPWRMSSGIEPERLEQLRSHDPDVVEGWGGKKSIDRLSDDDIHVRSWTASAWRTSPRWLEWDRPQGIADWLMIILDRDADSFSMIGLGRHQDDGPITRADIDATRMFLPHCQRAAAISRQLDVKTTTAAAFDAVLDGLSSAVILVAPDLRVVHANQAAEAMFSATDTLRCHGGTLRLSAPGATAALAAAIADAAGGARKNAHVPLRGRDGNACVLHVLPLRRDSRRPGLSPGAVAAVFVADGTRPGADVEALRLLFALTAAEAAVLEHIAAGRDVAQTAQALGVGTGTVRVHLQHCFDKTGVHRQADLAALLSSLALPLLSSQSPGRPKIDLAPVGGGSGRRAEPGAQLS